MKKIRVSLNEQDISKCIKWINSYMDDLKFAVKQNIQDIVWKATYVAEESFGPAVKVWYDPIDDEGYRYSIIANGRAVGFLEFGAGRLADASHPFAEDAPFAVGEAEYSVLNAQQYYRWGYWFFNGKKMYYVKPRRGLFETAEFIRESIDDMRSKLSAVGKSDL